MCVSVEGPVGPCLPDPVPHPQKPESMLGWGGAHKTPFWMLRGISICFPILCSNLVPNVRNVFPIIVVLLLGSIFAPVRGAGGEDRTKPKTGNQVPAVHPRSNDSRQTNKQTDKQTNTHTHKQTNKHTHKPYLN